MFSLAIARMAVRQWLQKSAPQRAADARAFAQTFIDSGVRNDIASVAPYDVTDAMDKFISAVADWRA